MTFWGVEIQPEKPYLHTDEDGMTKLHLSQATLGLDCTGKQRTVVKCKVGDNPEVLLCSLVPGVQESCALDLLFDQEVTFTVAGATSVHLTGYYMPLDDPYDSEDEDEYDLEEEGLEFSADDEDVNDLEGHPSSVKIEEVIGDEDAGAALVKKDLLPITNGERNEKKRKKGDSAVKAAKVEDTVMDEDDSEDEDGFAKKAAAEETPAKKQAVVGADGVPTPGAATPTADTPTSQGKKKKNKKKNKKNRNAPETPEAKANGEAGKATTPANTPAATTPAAMPAGKETTPKKGASAVKKFPNGLEVETLAIGKPDGKKAAAGKKVAMQYTGKLKSNGKVFDSTVGKKAFQFRLGVGEVIKGWDVGVDGMRIGDKRRLTIPPQMAYGAKGVPGTIPGNSWLTFDVELVNVK